MGNLTQLFMGQMQKRNAKEYESVWVPPLTRVKKKSFGKSIKK